MRYLKQRYHFVWRDDRGDPAILVDIAASPWIKTRQCFAWNEL
jgi:hypothetical protein